MKAWAVSVDFDGEYYDGWEIYPPGTMTVYCHSETRGRAKLVAMANDVTDLISCAEFTWLRATREPDFDNVPIPYNQPEKACDCTLCATRAPQECARF